MNRPILTSLLFVASIAMPSEAARLDQSFTPPDEPLLTSSVGYIGLGQKAEEAQTFVVGVGGQLTDVNLYIQGQGSGLLLEIVKTTVAGLPSDAPSDLLGVAFASSPVSSDGFQFVSFHLGEMASSVQPGEHLALVLIAPGSGFYDWGGSEGNPYAQGESATRSMFYNNQWSFPVDLNSKTDLGFQTFVEPVPEPSTFAILFVGSSGIILLTKHRKARRLVPDLGRS